MGRSDVPTMPRDLLPGWLGNMAAANSDATETPFAMSAMTGLTDVAAALLHAGNFRDVHGLSNGYVVPLTSTFSIPFTSLDYNLVTSTNRARKLVRYR